MKPLLLACEESGIVRDAFIKKGVNAISCDLLPTRRPGPHIQDYLEDIIGSGKDWCGIIAFPPCDFVCSSGLHHNKYKPGRQQLTELALHFDAMIFNRECNLISLENPVGCLSTRIENRGGAWIVRQPGEKHNGNAATQYVQPWQFGHPESKKNRVMVERITSTKADKCFTTTSVWAVE